MKIKKQFLVSLLLSISLFLDSCSVKKSADVTPNIINKKVKTININSSTGYNNAKTFKYDTQGRVILLTEMDGNDSYSIEIIYGDSFIIFKSDGDTYALPLNSQGFIKSDANGSTYEYDNNGFKTKYTYIRGVNNSEIFTYQNSNGNYIKATSINGSNTREFLYDYYTNYKNRIDGSIGDEELIGLPFIGKASINNIKTITETRNNKPYSVKNYNYEYDAEGYITKASIQETFTGKSNINYYVTTYTYQ